MKRLTLTVDPLCLVGDQHARIDGKKIGFGATKAALIGHTIVDVEEGRCGEIVLILQKKHVDLGDRCIQLGADPAAVGAWPDHKRRRFLELNRNSATVLG
jgi:hypothetical protein